MRQSSRDGAQEVAASLSDRSGESLAKVQGAAASGAEDKKKSGFKGLFRRKGAPTLLLTAVTVSGFSHASWQ
jgi:hypothetical protein